MWAGSGSWIPDGWEAAVLDAGGDDYFGTGRTDCPDLATSGFLTDTPPPDCASVTVSPSGCSPPRPAVGSRR